MRGRSTELLPAIPTRPAAPMPWATNWAVCFMPRTSRPAVNAAYKYCRPHPQTVARATETGFSGLCGALLDHQGRKTAGHLLRASDQVAVMQVTAVRLKVDQNQLVADIA